MYIFLGAGNITTFDHTKPYVRQLWLDTLMNATKQGSVGGVFADHGWGTNIGKPNPDGTSTLCNGAGSLRSWWVPAACGHLSD